MLDTNNNKGYTMTTRDKMLKKLITQGKVLSFTMNSNELMTFRVYIFHKTIEHRTYNKELIKLVISLF